jgi:hypothetical protein
MGVPVGPLRDFQQATVGIGRVRGTEANEALNLVQNASRTVSANNQYLDLLKRLDTIYRNSPLLSGRCERAARDAQKALQAAGQKADLIRITGSRNERVFALDGQPFSIYGYHVAVRSGDRIYDASTGPAGKIAVEYFKFLSDRVGLINPVLKPIK